MKLVNLPLTLASQTFLLSILFNPFQLKGDEQFNECLDEEQTIPAGANRTGLYNTINSFGSNHSDKINFCCDILLKCEVMSPPTECPFLSPPRIFTQCNSINGSKFCVSYGSSTLPSSICGGILGSANPINTTVGYCPSSDTIKNTLNSQQTIPNKFSWLCCNNENCKVPVNVKIKDPINLSATQEAATNCASGEYSLMCFRDNNVWICTGSIGSTISIWPNPIGSCLVQVSLNSSTPLPPSSTDTLSTSSPSSTMTFSTFSPENNRKGIMIGVLSGVSVVIIILSLVFLVRCLWRRYDKHELEKSRPRQFSN